MSRKLIFGSVSRERLMDLTPIGIVNGREIFPLRGAEDDADDTSSDDDDNDDDSNDDDSDGDDSKDDDSDDKGDAAKQKRRSTRGQHPADMRKELRDLRRFKREQDAAARSQELKDKPEIERLTAERDDAVKERDALREKFSSSTVELEIIKASRKKYDWADIEDVLNDRTLRKAIEIDDDGEISGVTEALKDLAKRKPHFLQKATEDDDDKSKSNGRAKSSGSGKSGGQPSGGANGDRSVDRQALNAKYPILGRIPQ